MTLLLLSFSAKLQATKTLARKCVFRDSVLTKIAPLIKFVYFDEKMSYFKANTYLFMRCSNWLFGKQYTPSIRAVEFDNFNFTGATRFLRFLALSTHFNQQCLYKVVVLRSWVAR